MSDWLPIATFFERQDRTGRVLLYVPAYGVTVANCEFTGFYVWNGDKRQFPGGDPKACDIPSGPAPTHWQPLPEPPESK